MSRFFSRFMLITALLSLVFALSSCSDDDKNDSLDIWDPGMYSVDIKFEGDINAYFKQATVQGTNTKGMPINPIDAKTGKEFNTFSFSDKNFEFGELNSFTFGEKLNFLNLGVGIGVPNDGAGDLKVTIIVRKDGKVVKTIEETATSTKDVTVTKFFGGK